MPKKTAEILNLKTIQSIEETVLSDLTFEAVVRKVVDDILSDINKIDDSYRIVVLTLIDKKDKVLKRISLSPTKEADLTLKASTVQFENILIPLNARKNACIKSIHKKGRVTTHDFKDILCPALSVKDARVIQNNAGIQTSHVYPIQIRGEVLGTVIFSKISFSKTIKKQEDEVLKYFTNLIGIAVQNSTLYSQIQEQTQKLKEANKLLKQLDRQKDEFISIASHELKTPISIAKNNLWMFKYASKNKFTKRQTHFLSELEGGISRLQKIVNDLLDISRMQQGRLILDIEKCSIFDVTLDAIDNFEDLAIKKGLEIIAPNAISDEVKLDSNRYIEVIENLLSNAIKYTEKGKITVKIEKQKKYYKISVTDTGPGIPTKDQTKIFKKFGRATQGLKMSTPGASTGLGLYITKSYVDAMGGKIGFNSKVGKGTEFWFTVPKTPPNAQK